MKKSFLMKNQYLKNYLTYNNEYISGKTYFLRLIFFYLLLFMLFNISIFSITTNWVLLLILLSLTVIPTLQFIFINSYKRGMSIGWDKLTSIIGAIICLSYPLIYLIEEFSHFDTSNLIKLLCNLINIILIYKNGKK